PKGAGETLCFYSVNASLRWRFGRVLRGGVFVFLSPADGTMDGEEVLTTNFLNPKADKSIMLLFTNGYVPPLPRPKRCYKLGQAIREVLDETDAKVLILATGGMSHYPGTPLYGHVDEECEKNVLAILASGKGSKLAEFSTDELLQSGNGELVNWAITAGICGDVKAHVIDYIRLWHIGLGYLYWEV